MSKSKVNQQAWSLLSEDEKFALGLQVGIGKSSWEAGEIMQKSHYKYLEIKYRAQYFLKLFTDHLETFESMIPPYIQGNKAVLIYFRACLERKKPREAIQLVYEKERVNKSMLHQKIVEQLDRWEKSDNLMNQAISHLIKEYDRWNNFRILPKSIQEPSAYKRRVKNTFKKHIKVLTALPDISIEKILSTYETKKAPYIYLPIIRNNEAYIAQVKYTSGSEEIFNTLGLYAFEALPDATEYANNVHAYITKSKKSCTDGLDFWPNYRELIKKAHNYNGVHNITPTRKYLQTALAKLKFV